LNPCKITKILITHWHGDHVLGLPGLMQTLIMNGYNKKLELYGPRGTSERVRKFFDLIGRKGKEMDVSVKEVKGGVVFDCEDFMIESFGVDHDCNAVGYNFVVKEKQRLDREKLAKLKLPNL
jgi:ribonuclease Z